MSISQKIALSLWIGLILATIVFFVARPDLLDGENMKTFIQNNGSSLKSFFAILCFIRCFTLIPATPFIVSGILLFPDDLWYVFRVCMITVLFAATLHFYFSHLLGFDKILTKKFSKSFEKAKTFMQKNGALYTFLWSIAPFLPSELIYYVAGLSNMRYTHFIGAIILGEFVILYAYIFLGGEMFQRIL